jgi:hypothetical protein
MDQHRQARGRGNWEDFGQKQSGRKGVEREWKEVELGKERG